MDRSRCMAALASLVAAGALVMTGITFAQTQSLRDRVAELEARPTAIPGPKGDAGPRGPLGPSGPRGPEGEVSDRDLRFEIESAVDDLRGELQSCFGDFATALEDLNAGLIADVPYCP